jgi:hypothetical protein
MDIHNRFMAEILTMSQVSTSTIGDHPMVAIPIMGLFPGSAMDYPAYFSGWNRF